MWVDYDPFFFKFRLIDVKKNAPFILIDSEHDLKLTITSVGHVAINLICAVGHSSFLLFLSFLLCSKSKSCDVGLNELDRAA